MFSGVNLNGFNALAKRLEQISKQEATKAGQAANRAGAAVLRKAVEKAAPDSPDTTEGEIRNRKNKSGGTRKEVHRKIKNWVRVKKSKSGDPTKVQNTVAIYAYHSTFVEFGSIHNAPDPFFQRAMAANDQSIIDAIAKALNKQLIKRGV